MRPHQEGGEAERGRKLRRSAPRRAASRRGRAPSGRSTEIIWRLAKLAAAIAPNQARRPREQRHQREVDRPITARLEAGRQGSFNHAVEAQMLVGAREIGGADEGQHRQEMRPGSSSPHETEAFITKRENTAQFRRTKRRPASAITAMSSTRGLERGRRPRTAFVEHGGPPLRRGGVNWPEMAARVAAIISAPITSTKDRIVENKRRGRLLEGGEVDLV